MHIKDTAPPGGFPIKNTHMILKLNNIFIIMFETINSDSCIKDIGKKLAELKRLFQFFSGG
jgi:hypothetical protein